MTDFYLASAANLGTLTSVAVSPPKIGAAVNLLCVGWIDDNQLTRECFANAAGAMQSLLVIVPFHSPREFLANPPPTVDLVVYHQHGDDTAGLNILTAGNGVMPPNNPFVILSDSASDSIHEAVARFPQGSATLLNTKRTSLQMVVASLFLIHHGREVVPPAQPAASAPPPPPIPAENSAEAGNLTKRERSVLELVRQGYANKDIATDLQMSVSTVKAHIRNIMQKKRASNRTQLALGAERQLRRSAAK
ncbi:response regulator transcription factor [Acidisoma cellulosilytica]|uniref:Response regulator transcription factor n=1 Tax=Acidisoma cellulosilyticum TaxID=2802395 RepID=A0A963YZ79_9PROT|nr:response regulator transcription factor [Acidisoma cellulosilyticum]MCB8879775.1 response regulator transcription factor [Acidisoma cellulosilyticum]